VAGERRGEIDGPQRHTYRLMQWRFRQRCIAARGLFDHGRGGEAFIAWMHAGASC